MIDTYHHHQLANRLSNQVANQLANPASTVLLPTVLKVPATACRIARPYGGLSYMRARRGGIRPSDLLFFTRVQPKVQPSIKNDAHPAY